MKGLQFKAMCGILIELFIVAVAHDEIITITNRKSGPAKPSTSIKYRILGGSEVTPHSFPYQVLIRMVTYHGHHLLCGGSLVTSRAVLTAAHCLYGVKSATIVLGAHDITEEESSQVHVFTTDFIIHPYYEHHTIRNDIAIAKLPKSIELNENIKLIPLQSKSERRMSFVGETATMSGWGMESDTKMGSTKLRSTSAKVITNEKCRETFPISVLRSQICLSGEEEKNSCQGDSGGPITVNINGEKKQIGIVSYGSEQCEVTDPGVCTRIAYYIDWIEANRGISNSDLTVGWQLFFIFILVTILF